MKSSEEVEIGGAYELLCSDTETNEPKMARFIVKEKGYYPNDSNPRLPDFPGFKVEVNGVEANLPAMLLGFSIKVELDNEELHKQVVHGMMKAASALKNITLPDDSARAYLETASAIYKSCEGLDRLAYTYVFEFITRNHTLLDQSLVDKMIEGDQTPAWNWTNEFMLKFGGHPTVEPVPIDI